MVGERVDSLDRELINRLKRALPRRARSADATTPGRVLVYASRTLDEKLRGLERVARDREAGAEPPSRGGFSTRMRHARRAGAAR